MITTAIPLIEKEKELEEEFIYLPQFYKISNEDKVIFFIKKHLFLLPILVDAPGKIYRIFPRDDIKLELELHHDPEEDYDELFVVIKSPYAPEKARELMDELGEEWFFNIMAQTKNKLCITVEPGKLMGIRDSIEKTKRTQIYNDLEILNQNSEYLNREAEDVLAYQVLL